MQKSEAITTPDKFAILLGRGGGSNNHHGNKVYQSVVEAHAVDYLKCSKRNNKTNIAWEIVHQLKQQGSRFLRKDPNSNTWEEVSDDEARRKVSQRLREVALVAKLHKPAASKGEGKDKGEGKPTAKTKVLEPEGKPAAKTKGLEPEGVVSSPNMHPAQEMGVGVEPFNPNILKEIYHGELLELGTFDEDMSTSSPELILSDAAGRGSKSDMSNSSLESLFSSDSGSQAILEWACSLPPFLVGSDDEGLMSVFHQDDDNLVPVMLNPPKRRRLDVSEDTVQHEA